MDEYSKTPEEIERMDGTEILEHIKILNMQSYRKQLEEETELQDIINSRSKK